jgi:hypothetical protein
MVLTRKLLPARRTSDVALQPPLIEALARFATGVERKLLDRGIVLPFGGSLIGAAVKQSSANA